MPKFLSGTRILAKFLSNSAFWSVFLRKSRFHRFEKSSGFRVWGAANGGLRDGGLRKSEEKGLFPPFLDFPGALQPLRKRAKKAEKGRKRPISADFREGRPDTP